MLSAVEYLRIVVSAFLSILLLAASTGIHNAVGSSRIPSYISRTGLLLNTVLDPLFILGFRLGTTGAAWATRISQAVVCKLFVCQLKCRDKLFGGLLLFVRLKEYHTKRIFRLGPPVVLLNIFFVVINLFMARIASTYGGHIGLMTLTTGRQMGAATWNTSRGFSVVPLAFATQSYTARRKKRVLIAYHMTLKMTPIIGVLCTLLFVFYGSEVFSLTVPG